LISLRCFSIDNNKKRANRASGNRNKNSRIGSSVVAVLNSASRWTAYGSSRVASSVAVDASEIPVSSVVVERPRSGYTLRNSWFARKTEPVPEEDHEGEGDDPICYSGNSLEPSVSVTAPASARPDAEPAFIPVGAKVELMENMRTYEVDGVRYDSLADSARAMSSKLAASARYMLRNSASSDTETGKCIGEEFGNVPKLSIRHGGYMSARSSKLRTPDVMGESCVPLVSDELGERFVLMTQTKVTARDDLAIIDL
jgi:hypothetical protein